jgi:hypothetical protein
MELPKVVGSNENDDDDAGPTFSRDITASVPVKCRADEQHLSGHHSASFTPIDIGNTLQYITSRCRSLEQ